MQLGGHCGYDNWMWARRGGGSGMGGMGRGGGYGARSRMRTQVGMIDLWRVWMSSHRDRNHECRIDRKIKCKKRELWAPSQRSEWMIVYLWDKLSSGGVRD